MSAKIEMGIERRITKVSVVTGLSTALSIGLQLVSVPVCLHYWGNETYGTWLALFAAFTLMRTVDGGYIGYVGNQLNMLYHRDQQALRVTLASAVWGVTLLGVLQLIILMALYATDTVGFIVDSQHSRTAVREAVLALSVLSVSWIFTGSYLGIVHRFLIPTGMMYQAAWWSMGFQLSQFAALITAAMLGLDILRAATLLALIQAGIYTTSAVYIKLKLPLYYPWWTGPSSAVGFSDLLRSVPLTLSGVLQQGGNSGLVMLVLTFCGPAAVPAFTTVRTLTNLWTTLINVLTTPLLPDVVRYYATADARKLLAVHQAHWLLVGSAVNLSILIAYPFLESVYGLWTRNSLPLDKPLMSLLLATVSLAGMSALTTTFLSGINHSGFILVSAVLRGGVALLLGALLLPAFGPTGLGIAVLLAEAFVLVVTVHWFFRNELARISGERTSFSILWSWMSSGCVVAYLVAESFNLAVASSGYWLAMAGVVLGSVFAWRGLSAELKTRFQSLLYTATGNPALR